MTEIRTKLDVAAKLANADTEFHDEIQLDETEAEDVSQQVAEYFGLDASHEGEVATASYTH
jgi:hypothetical protein